MIVPSNETRRRQDLARRVDQLSRGATVGPVPVVVRTVDGGDYPATAASVFLCEVMRVDFEEVEGAVVDLIDPPTPGLGEDPYLRLFVANIGPSVPPVGTVIVARLVEGRRVMSFGG